MALGSSSDELSPHLHVPRDTDLLLPDAHLNSVMLDEMWELFYGGMSSKDQVDLQLLFVRLVNSARKPYRDYISIMGCSSTICDTPSEGTAADYDPDRPDTPVLAPRRELDTPRGGSENNNEPGSEEQSNVPNEAVMDAMIKYMIEVFEQCKASLAASKRWLAPRHHLVLILSAILLFVYLCTPDKVPIRVAIKSAAHENRYLQLHGSGVTSVRKGGGGRSGIHSLIGSWETFELIPADSKNTHIFCFKSIALNNVYLHAEAKELQPGSASWMGGGVVNAQYGCGSHEKFRVWATGQQGVVSIESVAFPGRFLRMGTIDDSVNLQGAAGNWEKFYIVLIL